MICKAPGDNYQWVVDWSAELDADTINGSTWSVQSGITNDGDSFTASTTTIDLSGGTAGVTYELENTITTAGGDTWVKHLYIKVQEQIVG